MTPRAFCGAARRGLTVVARVSFWALAALIVAGFVLTLVSIPGADLAYSALSLVIFAGFTLSIFSGCAPMPITRWHLCWPPRSSSTC